MKTCVFLSVLLVLVAACKPGNSGGGQNSLAEMHIEGMVCQMGCANGIQKQLSKCEGVASAQVNFETGVAKVAFDPLISSLQKLKDAVEGIGGGGKYTVTSNRIVLSGDAGAADSPVAASAEEAATKIYFPVFPSIFEALIHMGKRV
jgi:copper chaperone CopZ